MDTFLVSWEAITADVQRGLTSEGAYTEFLLGFWGFTRSLIELFLRPTTKYAVARNALEFADTSMHKNR